MYVQRNTEKRSCNHCSRGKAITVTRYECVSVFLPYLPGTQSACSVLWHVRPACLYHIFSVLSHNRHDFRKKKNNEDKICVLIFSTTFV